MNSFNDKQLKEKINVSLSSSSMRTQLNDTEEEKSTLEDVISECNKVLLTKKHAVEKSEEIEKQFKDLKQKLNSNSEFLFTIKKQVEGLTFSHQKKVLERFNRPDHYENDQNYTSQEMTQRMEDIRKKIDDLRDKMAKQKEKQKEISGNYKEALKNVTDTFQEIEDGSNSSFMF